MTSCTIIKPSPKPTRFELSGDAQLVRNDAPGGHARPDRAHGDVLPVFSVVYVAGPPVLVVAVGVLFASLLVGPFLVMAVLVGIVVALWLVAVAIVGLVAGGVAALPRLLARGHQAVRRQAQTRLAVSPSHFLGAPKPAVPGRGMPGSSL